MIAEEHGLPYEEVDRWPRDKVQYYLARMAGLNQWRRHQMDERRADQRQEADERAESGAVTPSTPDAYSGTPGTSTGAYAPSTPPDGWAEEEWRDVPTKLRGAVASGKGAVSKEAIRKMQETDPEDYYV